MNIREKISEKGKYFFPTGKLYNTCEVHNLREGGILETIMDCFIMPQKRKLPKLMACMTKNSVENMRNKALFNVDFLDAKGIRRRRMPLHECLILELREAGYTESSNYLQDLLYDNLQLVQEDDIGIVVDLRKREDYLEHICNRLQVAEKERDRENTKKECLTFLSLAMQYMEKGKGILWLAEKFYLAAIAVSSKHLIDGGRLKSCCKYHYAKFLLDKFPGADTEESYQILTEVRDCSYGKDWPLHDPDITDEPDTNENVFFATAIQLHRVLLSKSRAIRKSDPAKSERLARLAERRAKDAENAARTAEAIIDVGICQLIMNNLNNAQKTFERAYKIHSDSKNIDGICETKMHLAAVMQRMGEYEIAAKLLTEMGCLAMESDLTRQLGRALHLLGELHLRRERPELGTQHLAEAFSCFMGLASKWTNSAAVFDTKTSKLMEGGAAFANDGDLDQIFKASEKTEIYEEEAEQSRLMMAISAGQELMASYFQLIRQAGDCTIAKVKCIEWKLSRSNWWINREKHELVPCLCPLHERSPLDVLWYQIKLREMEDRPKEERSMSDQMIRGERDVNNLQMLRSSFMPAGAKHSSHTAAHRVESKVPKSKSQTKS